MTKANNTPERKAVVEGRASSKGHATSRSRTRKHADIAKAPRAAGGAAGGKVRARERASVTAKSPQSVEELHRRLHAAVTVGAQLDALIELGLTDFDLQKLTNRSRTAIFAWRRETALPPAEIAEIIDNTRYAAASLLSSHVPFDAAGLLAWLRARSMDLKGRRPLDALAEGEFRSVVKAGRRWVGADPPSADLTREESLSEVMAKTAASN